MSSFLIVTVTIITRLWQKKTKSLLCPLTLSQIFFVMLDIVFLIFTASPLSLLFGVCSSVCKCCLSSSSLFTAALIYNEIQYTCARDMYSGISPASLLSLFLYLSLSAYYTCCDDYRWHEYPNLLLLRHIPGLQSQMFCFVAVGRQYCKRAT